MRHSSIVDLSDINPHILFNNDNSSNDDDQKNTKRLSLTRYSVQYICCVYDIARGIKRQKQVRRIVVVMILTRIKKRKRRGLSQTRRRRGRQKEGW